jgi:tetratricopeptide (TPR) repeat protein
LRALWYPQKGFFDIYPFRYSYVADHFQYLACIGLIVLAVSVGTTVFQRAGRWGHDLGSLAAAITLLILGASVWTRAPVYQNSETLWRDTIARNPQCWLAHYNLGSILWLRGRINEAIAQYEQALRIKPDFAEARNALARLQGGAGKTRVTRGPECFQGVSQTRLRTLHSPRFSGDGGAGPRHPAGPY